jgi:hypothetical protein
LNLRNFAGQQMYLNLVGCLELLFLLLQSDLPASDLVFELAITRLEAGAALFRNKQRDARKRRHEYADVDVGPAKVEHTTGSA